MQKFVQRCRVRIFCNECTRSTPLDPKLMFCFVSFRLGAFGTVSLLHETCCKCAKLVQLMEKFVPWCLVRIFCNERSRSTTLDPKLIFGAFLSVWCIWNCFATARNSVQMGQPGAINARVRAQSLVRISRNRRSRSTQFDHKLMFSCVSFRLGGTIMLLHKLDAKHAKLVQLIQMFVPRGLVRNFCNERSRSTPLESKLMFWCVSFHLGAFGTVSLLHETCYKTRQTGEINAKVRAIKSCRNFSQRRSQSTP